jgi:hypothetical protein
MMMIYHVPHYTHKVIPTTESEPVYLVKKLDSPESRAVAVEHPATRGPRADDIRSTVAGFESDLKVWRDSRDGYSG